MTLNVTVSGANQRLRFDWPAASRSWAAAVQPEATALMRARSPFLTGKLRQGISSRTETAPESTSVVIYGTASYLPFVLNGTSAHTIVPRHVGGVLRWIPNRGHGSPVFATKVSHPGTKANPFPEEAMKAATPMLLSRFSEAVQEAIVIE